MTTKYTYFHTQTVSYLNNGYMPDPVSTAGASGGFEGVLNSIKSGTPHNLTKYFQFTKHRFKHRLATWKFARVTDGLSTNNIISVKDIRKLEPSLADKRILIMHEYRTPVSGGAKYYADMNNLFGLNEFNNDDGSGNLINISALNQAESIINGLQGTNNWIVGNLEDTSYKPVVILDPANTDLTKLSSDKEFHVLSLDSYVPEPSVGLVYQYASNPPEIVKDEVLSTQSVTSYTQPNNIINPEVELNTSIDNNSPISTTDDSDIKYDSDGNEIGTVETYYDSVVEEFVVYNYSILKPNSLRIRSGDGATRYTYEVEHRQVTKKFTYDSEGYIWGTETDNSHPDIWDIYKGFQRNSEVVYWSFDNNHKSKFKFYPYLPLRENGISNLSDTTPQGKVSKVKEVVDALKTQAKSDKPESLNEAENPKLNRTNKLETTKPTIPESERAEQSKAKRTLLRSKAKNRKLKVNNRNGFTRQDDRKFTEAGKLLNTDVKLVFDSLLAQESEDKVYQMALSPAVMLDPNMDISSKYWYKFFSRIYRMLEDGGYGAFYNSVKAMEQSGSKNYSKLPRYELTYRTGKLAGFLSFAYIKEFKMKGDIRDIKRMRRVSDIRRGVHKQLFWSEKTDQSHINTTKYSDEFFDWLLRPEESFANDSYHTTSSGKDYNIGGAKVDEVEYSYTRRWCDREVGIDGDSECENVTRTEKIKPQLTGIDGETSRNFVMFNWFGYTFFCMPSGEDEVNVIAVAGLLSGTSSAHFSMNTVHPYLTGSNLFANAWHELDMVYQRNHKKYIEKKADKEINVSEEFYKGWSKKYRTSNRISNFFVVPLDYKTYTRMGGTDRLRFADRAVLMYSWNGQEQKKKSNAFAKIFKVVMLVVAIAVAIYTSGAAAGMWGTMYGASAGTASAAYGGIQASVVSALGITSTAGVFAVNLAINAVIAVGVSKLISQGVKLLNKVLGSNGFLTLVITMVVIAAASYTGVGQNVLASLPYASQVPYTQIIRSATGSLVNQAHSSYMENIQKELQNIQKNMEQEQQKFNEASYNLAEKEEEFQSRGATYDVTTVLNSLKFKMIEPNMFTEFMTTDISYLASYSFLENFLNLRLSLDLESFDEVKSLDFSLPLNKAYSYV